MVYRNINNSLLGKNENYLMDSKPIYYKSKQNSHCYKLVMKSDNQEDIDALLDALSPEISVFITEDEFVSAYDKFMDIDIKDDNGERIIARLTTRYLEDMKEDDFI